MQRFWKIAITLLITTENNIIYLTTLLNDVKHNCRWFYSSVIDDQCTVVKHPLWSLIILWVLDHCAERQEERTKHRFHCNPFWFLNPWEQTVFHTILDTKCHKRTAGPTHSTLLQEALFCELKTFIRDIHRLHYTVD